MKQFEESEEAPRRCSYVGWDFKHNRGSNKRKQNHSKELENFTMVELRSDGHRKGYLEIWAD